MHWGRQRRRGQPLQCTEYMFVGAWLYDRCMGHMTIHIASIPNIWDIMAIWVTIYIDTIEYSVYYGTTATITTQHNQTKNYNEDI